ncbi:tripartite motif-containing 45-like, partial [Paramuricea clavata]
MEELSKPENRKKINDKMYCNEHSGMILKVYCKTCDQLICRDCMDFKHVKQGHSCVLVKDVANNYKELLASNNRAMEDVLTEGNALLQRLMLTTEQLDRDAENIKSQIVQKNDIVLKTVAGMMEQKTKMLLNKVDEIRKAGRAKLDRKAEETKLYIENVKGSVQLSKTLVDQGTEEEIISSQKMMLDNANNLLTNREEYFKAPIPVNKLSYTVCGRKEPIHKEILRELANSLGEVNDDNYAGTGTGTGTGITKQTFLRIAAESATHSETIKVNQKLDDRQFAEILEVQNLHNVCIECEPVIGFIRISGLAKNVSNAVGEIHRIIYAWEQEKQHTDATVRE